MIRFNCSNCGFLFQIEDSAAGKRGKCKQCGQLVTVPNATASVEIAKVADVLPPMGQPIPSSPLNVYQAPVSINPQHSWPDQQVIPHATPVFLQVNTPPQPTPAITHVNQSVVVHAPASNGLGTAGFVTSLCGLLLTCGLLCPVGLLMSLVALLKPPRGMAIARVLIGAIGSWWVIAFGGAMLLAVLGIAAGARHVSEAMVPFQLTTQIESRALKLKRLLTPTEIQELTNEFANQHQLSSKDISIKLHGNDRVEVATKGPDGLLGTQDDFKSEANMKHFLVSPSSKQ